MTSAPPYRPYVGGAFRWRLGLRPLDLADWIEFGDDADRQLADKARVCEQHHDTAFAVIDGIEPEAVEVLDALVGHLRRWFPERAEAVASLPPGLHPLDAAGRLVQEDLALLVERDGQLVMALDPKTWTVKTQEAFGRRHRPGQGRCVLFTSQPRADPDHLLVATHQS
jgi:hypothetical protein